jgi:DNA-binding transcriptional regulator YiaG
MTTPAPNTKTARKISRAALPEEDEEITVFDLDLSAPQRAQADSIRADIQTHGSTFRMETDAGVIAVPVLTPAQFKAIRHKLGLTGHEFGLALGYGAKGAKVRVSEFEHGGRPIPHAISLLASYIERYGLLRGE